MDRVHVSDSARRQSRRVPGWVTSFGPLADFFGGLAGRGDRLFADGGDALARLAADDVAEGVLEALGAAVGREALLGLAPACSGLRSP